MSAHTPISPPEEGHYGCASARVRASSSVAKEIMKNNFGTESDLRNVDF
jgi:hypothetical protein